MEKAVGVGWDGDGNDDAIVSYMNKHHKIDANAAHPIQEVQSWWAL